MRTAFSKNGGNLGASGSVSHGFYRLGLIEYPGSAGDADKVFEAAIEAGADDVESDEDGHRIWTSIEGLHEAAQARSSRCSAKPKAPSSRGARRPKSRSRGDDAANLMKLIDALDEDDDVQTVWGNYERSARCRRKELEEACLIEMNPRPRPRARNHRLGADRGRWQSPQPCRQRPDQDRPADAVAAAPRAPRGPARRADRRASARRRRGRGSVRQPEPAIDAQARPGARRRLDVRGARRNRGRRICRRLVKKAVVGTGSADKAQVHAMVARLLPGVKIAGPDAADALAVAITHAHHLATAARPEPACACEGLTVQGGWIASRSSNGRVHT